MAEYKWSDSRKSPKGIKPIKGLDLSPITLARNILGSRLTEKHGSYYLDGQPASLHKLMKICDLRLERDTKL